MTRSELVLKIAQKNPNLPQSDIEAIVRSVFQKISDSLAEGYRVELRGFGTFVTRERQERIGRNPQTGAPVHVSKRRVLVFRAGKVMHRLLNHL